jgi:hypothetical protein
MFHWLRNRLAGRLAGIAVCWLLFATALVAQDDMPLLPEDVPEELAACDLGSWDSLWVYESTEVEGEDHLTYVVKAEPKVLGERQKSGCSGSCKGTSIQHYQDKYHTRCETDADCPIDENHKACRRAMQKALLDANAKCKGTDCVCFAKPAVIEGSYKGNCESGYVHNYCSYTCSACAEGNCLQYPKSDCSKKQ